MKLGSLFSLKEFHTTFFEFYGKYRHSFLSFKDCCESCEKSIQYLEETFVDEECLDYEVIEAHYEFSSQQKIREISFFDTKYHTKHIVALSLIDEEIDDEYCLDAHKYSPQEIILAATQCTDQLEVKEEIQQSETNQYEVNNEKEHVILDPVGAHINTVVVKQGHLTNHQVKVVEHIIEDHSLIHDTLMIHKNISNRQYFLP